MTLNSLIPAKNSLFLEIFSLLICLGNCAKSDCGAAVSCYEIGPGSPEIAKFPVKFPVSREFPWRRVRSTLRRQPPISVFREFPFPDEKGPPNAGFFLSSQVSGDRYSHFFDYKFPKVSSQIQENSRFLETRLGDRRISPLRARGSSAFPSLSRRLWTRYSHRGRRGRTPVSPDFAIRLTSFER